MRLFLIGCEYAGTTTLAFKIRDWVKAKKGIDFGSVHDHWKIPDVVVHTPDELTEQETQQFLALSTRVKEAYMRHNLYYHTPHGIRKEDQLIIGHYIEDTIYANLYYNYGGPGQAGFRTAHSKTIEEIVMKLAPETILILVKASPEAIRKRMLDKPHKYPVVREKDIETVLQAFESSFQASQISNKISIDTTRFSPDESLVEFAKKIRAFS